MAYLGGTPLGDLLLSKVDWVIRDEDCNEHVWCIARTGHGKTTGLLEGMVLQWLQRPDPPSLFCVDRRAGAPWTRP